MKPTLFAAALCAFAISLTSCGGGSSSSSSDPFGEIISTQKKYKDTKSKLEGSMNENNYKSKQEEIGLLKEESIEKIKKEASELNGKEIACTADSSQLTIKQPVTLVMDEMNQLRPMFKLAGDVVAATDLNLNADKSDLCGQELLSGAKVSVTVSMPVYLDILDKDGNVLKHMPEIGVLPAENLKSSAVVKGGTPVEFRNNFAVDDGIEGATSLRIGIDLSKAPYTSRNLIQ